MVWIHWTFVLIDLILLSVQGLSIDFLYYNVFGFLCYSVSELCC